jgi:hypothetical protein
LLQEKEEALTKVVAKLPIDDELYANMLSELQVISKDRATAEKEFLEFKLREDPDFAMPEGAFAKRRERIRDRLNKVLDFGEKGEIQVYKKYDGFYLWIDHIVNLPRHFNITFMTVEVYDATGDRHETIKTMT